MRVKLKKNRKLVISRGLFCLRDKRVIYRDLANFLRENNKVGKWIKVSLEPFEGCVKIKRYFSYSYVNDTCYVFDNSYFNICNRELTRYFKCIPAQIYAKL